METLLTDFWNDVCQLLVDRFHFTATLADAQVEKYSTKITDVAVMHFGAERFAEGIVERVYRTQRVVFGNLEAEIGLTFIKRLSANDVGETGSHQGGSFYIPKAFESFFPPLQGDKNPSATIKVAFVSVERPVELRFVFYRPAKDDRRLTPIPRQVIRNAHGGDFFLLRKRGKSFDAAVVHSDDPLHGRIKAHLGNRVAVLTLIKYMDIINAKKG